MFVVLLMMLHPTQKFEPPANPGRFTAEKTYKKKRSQKTLCYDKQKALAARQGLDSCTVPVAKCCLAEMLHWQGYSKAAIARTLRVSQVTVRGYLAGQSDAARD